MTAPRIDVHVHLAGSGCCESGCSLSPQFKKRYTFRLLRFLQGIDAKQIETTIDRDWAERISRLVGESPLDYAVVLGFDGVYHDGELDAVRSQMIVPPSWVFRVCREHPNLLPGPSLNPHRKDALEQLDHCLAEGAVLIKWLPSAQLIDAQAPLDAFYQRLANAGVPLLVHIGGERTFASLSPELNELSRLVPALEAGVKVIVAHSATPIIASGERNQVPELITMLERYPHLWVDNSGLCNPGRFAHLPHLASHPLVNARTLYGSDWPVPTNAFYYWRKLGLRGVRTLERDRNPFGRDIATKLILGYHEDTLTRASQVLANLDRWIKPASRTDP